MSVSLTGSDVVTLNGRVFHDFAQGDVITLDFLNTNLGAGARAGVELTLETAKELRAALDRAIASAEHEEAEVRGKRSAPHLVLVA